MRLLEGRVLGAGSEIRDAIVVGVIAWRLIRLASASVPVFTDQRSTPQEPLSGSCSSPPLSPWTCDGWGRTIAADEELAPANVNRNKRMRTRSSQLFM